MVNDSKQKPFSAFTPSAPGLRSSLRTIPALAVQFITKSIMDSIAFIRATWLDWILIGIIAGLSFALFKAPHVFERYFHFSRDIHGQLLFDPHLNYPHLDPIFSSLVAAIVSTGIPIFILVLSQIWIRSFVSYSAALLGLHYAIVTGTFVQVLLKTTIGGFRPHFLAVCQPDPQRLDWEIGMGYDHNMYLPSQLCTGDQAKIKFATESFPSGHAESAFAGFGFLALYLAAQLQVWDRDSDRRPRYWSMLAVVLPLAFATYLSATLVLKYQHHWYDVVGGMVIGAVCAVLGYRMVFRGVLDGKFNRASCLEFSRGAVSPKGEGLLENPAGAGVVGSPAASVANGRESGIVHSDWASGREGRIAQSDGAVSDLEAQVPVGVEMVPKQGVSPTGLVKVVSWGRRVFFE